MISLGPEGKGGTLLKKCIFTDWKVRETPVTECQVGCLLWVFGVAPPWEAHWDPIPDIVLAHLHTRTETKHIFPCSWKSMKWTVFVREAGGFGTHAACFTLFKRFVKTQNFNFPSLNKLIIIEHGNMCCMLCSCMRVGKDDVWNRVPMSFPQWRYPKNPK